MNAVYRHIEHWCERFSKRHSRRNLYELLNSTISEMGLASAKNALSVGAGGEISRRLKQQGVLFRSVDIDAELKPDILTDVANMAAVCDSSVDVIFCLEVLEHVSKPCAAISEIARILKPGGIVVGSTPFILGQHSHHRDYFRYTRFGLQHLFAEFTEVRLVARNSYMQSVTALISRLYARATVVNKRRMVLLLPLVIASVGINTVLDKFVDCRDATTGYFFVYRKPYENF